MLVLVTAGTGALHDVVPITLVIVAMLVLLVVSYSQVIEAHPEGGGAYSVAKANLGRWPSLLAAAAVIVDYVLTVAVSLAAGAASLASVFPALAHHLLAVALVGLGLLTVDQHVRDRRVRAAADGADRDLHREHARGDRGGRVSPAPGGGDRNRPNGFR